MFYNNLHHRVIFWKHLSYTSSSCGSNSLPPPQKVRICTMLPGGPVKLSHNSHKQQLPFVEGLIILHMQGRSRVVVVNEKKKQAEMCRFLIKTKKKTAFCAKCQLPSTIHHASRFVCRSLSRDRCPTNKRPYCYVRRKEGRWREKRNQ